MYSLVFTAATASHSPGNVAAKGPMCAPRSSDLLDVAKLSF